MEEKTFFLVRITLINGNMLDFIKNTLFREIQQKHSVLVNYHMLMMILKESDPY